MKWCEPNRVYDEIEVEEIEEIRTRDDLDVGEAFNSTENVSGRQQSECANTSTHMKISSTSQHLKITVR